MNKKIKDEPRLLKPASRIENKSFVTNTQKYFDGTNTTNRGWHISSSAITVMGVSASAVVVLDKMELPTSV